MRIIDPPTEYNQWRTLIPRVETVVPEGYQTIREIAIMLKRSRPHTYRLIDDLYKDGKLDRIIARRPQDKYPIPRYRPKDYETKTAKGPKHSRHR